MQKTFEETWSEREEKLRKRQVTEVKRLTREINSEMTEGNVARVTLLSNQLNDYCIIHGWNY